MTTKYHPLHKMYLANKFHNPNRRRERVFVTTDPTHKDCVEAVCLGRYSHRCQYEMMQYNITLFGRCSVSRNRRTLVIETYEPWTNPQTQEHHTIKAIERRLPIGFTWEVSRDGVILIRHASDPDFTYLLSKDEFTMTTTDIVEDVKWILQKRLMRQQMEDAISKLASYCKVTQGDSLAAGNCIEGTREFAATNGADANDPYAGIDADRLMDYVGLDTQRVRAAARMAVARQTEVCI